MSILSWAVAVAVSIPAVVIATYPFHVLFVRRRSRRARQPALRASISVVVPLKGQDEGRAEVLRRLLSQRAKGPIEWIFCVEDRGDPAVPELRRLAADDPRRVRLLITGPSGERIGKIHNLMAGVSAASGEHLVFVDGDTILPHADYLGDFTARLEDRRVGLITCFPAYRRARSVAGALLAGTINHDLLGHFALQSVWGGLRLANGSCLAIRRDVLERIGGFEPQQSSVLMDVILARRVHADGYRVVMHHEPVEVPCRSVTWGVWWNQIHRWQVGMARVLSSPFYAWYCWMRSALPAALLLALFASGPLQAVGVVAFVGRSLVTVTMGQAFIRDRAELNYVWLLPIADILAALGCWYALAVRRVEWRGRVYRIMPGGVARRLA